jgi:shikimate dehydrogenase
MITSTTRLVALLGHPVAFSLSPRMQNAAFAARALDWAYVALDVQPDRLAEAVRGLAAAGFAGANVTTPHKVAVLELCDELDDVAARAESVNTLVIANGRVHGSSTDAQALDGIDARRAVVLGAGGAARAWRAALEQRRADVRTYTRSGEWPPETNDADLIVNATPVVDEALVDPHAGQAIVDLAYRVDGCETALVAAARAAGSRAIVDGLEVLVRQGAASFERWTGVQAPLEIMRAVLRG